MTLFRKLAAVLLAASAGAATLAFSLRAQQIASATPEPATPPATASLTLVVLDPAHGGSDAGAMFGSVAEKDVTLALASRLRGALTSSGFSVISTRDADPIDPLTTDQRAETANRTHPLACIVLHATNTGSGVHVYTSALQPPVPDAGTPDLPASFAPVPWDTAQSKFVAQSLSLASSVTLALGKDHLPALSGQARVRPLDNLMCPAIAIELAPLLAANAGSTPPTDAAYQQQLATTLTNALRSWRDHTQASTASRARLDSQISAQARANAAARARAPDGAATAKAQP